LNSTALPSITEVAEPKNRGAVRDHRDEVAFGGVIEGAARIFGDGKHRNRDARRIGEREVALGRHRLRRHHFDFAGAALLMKLEGFLIGERRPGATSGRRGHWYSPHSGHSAPAKRR
jgi:hypothetical protein